MTKTNVNGEPEVNTRLSKSVYTYLSNLKLKKKYKNIDMTMRTIIKEWIKFKKLAKEQVNSKIKTFGVEIKQDENGNI